jgi:ribosomal protein S18 acetylase RimI-like enzyme
MTHPLDNPIWQALTTSQAQFAEICGPARRFPSDITSLGAFSTPSAEAYDSLAGLVGPGEVITFLLEEPAEPPSGWTVVEAVPLLQMIYADCSLSTPPSELIELTEADAPEMLALTAMTRPGPFGKRTGQLGLYLGIRRGGALVAMAGERLRMPGYAEVSAVCTHPDYQGQGYAAILITALVARMRQCDERPFLHVRPENRRAVELYRRLGFTARRLLQMAALRSARNHFGP